jgi:hypothetical protein
LHIGKIPKNTEDLVIQIIPIIGVIPQVYVAPLLSIYWKNVESLTSFTSGKPELLIYFAGLF